VGLEGRRRGDRSVLDLAMGVVVEGAEVRMVAALEAEARMEAERCSTRSMTMFVSEQCQLVTHRQRKGPLLHEKKFSLNLNQ
jgi:hypothetical protein